MTVALQPARWYFSLRSPYSYFAYRKLTEDFPTVADQLEWIPCWEPDEASQALLDQTGDKLSMVPMSRAKHLYILQDTRRIARASGLSLAWPVDRDPRWEVAHLGYLAAAAAGHGRDYLELAHRARWEQGRDINDPVTTSALATELGLPPQQVAYAAEDPELRRQGAACLTRALPERRLRSAVLRARPGAVLRRGPLPEVVAGASGRTPPVGPDQAGCETTGRHRNAWDWITDPPAGAVDPPPLPGKELPV